MKKISAAALHLIFCLSFSACAYLIGEPEPEDTSPAYLTGEGLEATLSSQDISEKLIKRFSAAGGRYKMSLLPITKPLLTKRAQEHGRDRALNANEIAVYLSQQEKALLEKKMCFEINYIVLQNLEQAQTSGWQLTLLDEHNNSYDLNWQNHPAPIEAKSVQYHGETPIYSNQVIACSEAPPLKPENGFKVVVIHKFRHSPYSDTEEIQWRFDQISYVEGEKHTVKPAKKKEKYRGW